MIESKPVDVLNPEMAQRKKHRIEALGQKIHDLAAPAEAGRATYQEFEAILGELHKLGFFPETSLVSAVAHASMAT